MIKKIILTLFLICGISIFSIDLYTGSDFGVVVEKGNSLSRNALFTGLRLGIENELPLGRLNSGLSYQTGSLLGSVSSLSLDSSWHFPVNENYSPGLGLIFDLDFGDYILFSNGGVDIPSTPIFYGGIVVQPLLFNLDNYRVSLFKSSILFGKDIPFRLKVSFMELSLNPSLKKTVSSGIKYELSTGLDMGIAENFFMYNIAAPDIKLNIQYSFLSLGVQYQNILPDSETEELKGSRISGEFTIVKDSGKWNPEVGFGFQYSEHNYKYNANMGTYGIIKPLKYSIKISDTTSITLSTLEIKYGPLYPNNLTELYNSGNFLLHISPIRFGVKIHPSRGIK